MISSLLIPMLRRSLFWKTVSPNAESRFINISLELTRTQQRIVQNVNFLRFRQRLPSLPLKLIMARPLP